MTHRTPEELKYTSDHEWALVDENNVMSVGLTDFAQSSLGDIVFVELPEVGTDVEKASPCGVVESIKSVSDLFSPASGEVVDVNKNLEENPGLCNEDPYENWIMKIKLKIDN